MKSLSPQNIWTITDKYRTNFLMFYKRGSDLNIKSELWNVNTYMDIESGGTIMQRLKWKRKCMGEGREIIWGGKKSKVATNIIRIVWTFFISNGHRYLYWHAYIIYVLATLHYVFATPCDVLDTLHNVLARTHDMLATPHDMSATTCGVLAPTDSHVNSRGLEVAIVFK